MSNSRMSAAPADTPTRAPGSSQPAQAAARSPPRFVTIGAAVDRTGLSRSYLYEQIAKDAFPKPVKLGDTKRAPIRFVESEVDAWIDAKILERDQA